MGTWGRPPQREREEKPIEWGNDKAPTERKANAKGGAKGEKTTLRKTIKGEGETRRLSRKNPAWSEKIESKTH